MIIPYIGVTGFTDHNQVLKVLNSSGLDENSGYQLMVGVLISDKSLAGIRSKKYPNRYPAPDTLNRIFVNDSRCLNIFHFHTNENRNLSDSLSQLTEKQDENLDGFQLNMCWPDPAEIEKFKSRYPDQKIILQVGIGALEQIRFRPTKLAEKVEGEYVGLIDYLLIDQSGGTGADLNPEILTGYLDAIYDHELNSTIGMVVAGGLCSETMNAVAPLLDEFGPLSIDAEGKLRSKNDRLKISAVKAYLKAASSLRMK